MPSTSDTEAGVRAAVLAILHDWVDGSAEATDRFLAAVDDAFTGHGTGPGETYADRAALRAMVAREHAGMSYPFTLDVPHMTVRVLGGAAVASGEMAIRIEMEAETVVEAPRFTFVLDREAGRGGPWRLVHFHFSVPDAMQDEGGTMDDLLATRNSQLQDEVERQTAALHKVLDDLRAAQARLVQQEKLASLGQLTAGIAHEIKNPLNFVTGFADLSVELADELEAETDADERDALLADLRANVAKIAEHGRRADNVVRAMMAHARGGGGEPVRLDLDALVAEYAALAYHGMKARHPAAPVAFEQDLGGAGEVVAVGQDLGRVLINLLDNAFDAVRGRADPRVAVSTHRVGDRAEVRVTDNGPGMSAGTRDRVFEPFYTTKPTGEGTGLGLSLAHDIVAEGHGGALTVETAEGEGTTFVVSLPAAE